MVELNKLKNKNHQRFKELTGYIIQAKELAKAQINADGSTQIGWL